MSEEQINAMEQGVAELQEQLEAQRAQNKALAEAARNIALERDGWRARAMRLFSDRACMD